MASLTLLMDGSYTTINHRHLCWQGLDTMYGWATTEAINIAETI